MPSFPDFKGRNPSGNELPKVTGGDSLRPRDINRLSTGIDRTTLRSTIGGGFRIKRSDGGTIITQKDNVSQYHWRCTKDNNHIHINIGDVWGLGVVNREKKQILTNVNYDGLATEKRYYQGCPDVMIGVENATHIAASKLLPNERLYVPAKKGIYYIKYTTWTGQPAGSSTPSDPAIVALKGTQQVCLLFSENASIIQNDPYVYPICEVDDDGLVWQGVDSPIFISRSEQQHEWKVNLVPTGSEFRVVVTRATICNVVPKYDGTNYELEQPDVDAWLTLDGGTEPEDGIYSVLLECEADASSYIVHFPKTAFVKIQKDYNPYTTPDTATKAYLRLADIIVTTDSQTNSKNLQVYQYLRSSLWAERQKWNDGLQYFFYQMNAT